MPRIRDLVSRARDSLFFVPVTMILIGAGLAGLSLLVDSRVFGGLGDIPVIISATASGGRAIATTVAGATITVAAIVISITALSTQMAATQYSPRAVSGFFEDSFQQFVIGFVVGTFTYAVVILAGLNDVLNQTEEATPTVSVTLVIVLGVVSAIAIVAYIDHSLRRMQVDSVVRRIADASLRAVRRTQTERLEEPKLTEIGLPKGESEAVKSDTGGWIVDIDAEAVLEALAPSSTARVEVRVGEAISHGDRIATVWANSGDAKLSAKTISAIQAALKTKKERSVEADPTFGIRQLVDIGLRALSPGVNDPTTAVDVIHHLKVPLREILATDPPLRVLEGKGERRVFLAERPSRSDHVHAAFAEIRLAAGEQPTVLRALLEVLSDLRNDLDDPALEGRLAAVDEEFRLVLEQTRKADLPQEDIDRILKGHRIEDDEGS